MSFKLDLSGFKKLEKMLENIPQAKVGILSGKNQREDSNGNADIGYKHEFGIGVPKRSFIREPLIQNMGDKLKDAGFNEEVLEEALENKSLHNLVAKIGIVGVSTIQDAFQTGFNGQWAPHAKGYENNTGQILVDTQQLRNSIISEVEDV